MKRLMIMAAGTGGHIFPGLAIAHTMRAQGWEVSWLGTSTGMEQQLVPQHGVAMDSIAFTGMRGKGWQHTLAGGFRILKAFADCFRFIGQRKPDVVLGMGGYVTVPGGLMARLRGVPLVLVLFASSIADLQKSPIDAGSGIFLMNDAGDRDRKSVV